MSHTVTVALTAIHAMKIANLVIKVMNNATSSQDTRECSVLTSAFPFTVFIIARTTVFHHSVECDGSVLLFQTGHSSVQPDQEQINAMQSSCCHSVFNC